MAKVINRSQQVVVGGLKPAAAYSRVVILAFDVPGGAGQSGFAYTEKFGQNLWLWNVQFWFVSKTVGTPCFINWKVVQCYEVPRDFDQIIQDMDPVMTMNYAGAQYMGWRSDSEHFSFDMMKFYGGKPPRFAVAVGNGSVPGLICMCSFEISEG